MQLLVLGMDAICQRGSKLDIDFTQIVPINTTPIKEGLCFSNPRVPEDDVLYEHCSGTWEDWFKVGPECLTEDFPVMQDMISRYNGLYPLQLNQAKDLQVTRREPGVTPGVLRKKYIKLAQGFLRDAKDRGLMVPPRVTVMVGELSAYKACQAMHREDRRKRAASRRRERGKATKTVSFQVDEPTEEEGQQLGARATSITTQAPWSGPDAAAGVTTFLATGHPGHASHTSSTGAASNTIMAQGQAQVVRCGPLQEHQGQTVAGSSGGAKGHGGATARNWAQSECGPEHRQKASASLEAGHTCAQRD